MTIKPGMKDALWMAAGMALMFALILVVLNFHKLEDPAERLASKAGRADLVSQMQLALISASEAEKSAVLAITYEASRSFADQARATTADLERQRRELSETLVADGTQVERDLLARFAQAFAEFQRVDDEVLALAVGNTNLKAYALAFGPAADAVEEMNAALSRVVAAHADSPVAKEVMRLGLGAQVAALRIATLLPPHIAEASEPAMDELDARMAREDEQVRKDLADLAALGSLRDDADLTTAASHYARFGEIRSRMLPLSRENTNVRALALSLGEKRKVMLQCLDVLNALQEAILAEPIAGVTYGRLPRPQ